MSVPAIRRLEGHFLVAVVPIGLVVAWLVGMVFDVNLSWVVGVYLLLLGVSQMPAYLERRRVAEAIRATRKLRAPPRGAL